MSKKFFRELIQTYLGIDLVIMIALSLLVMWLKLWLGVVCLGIVAAAGFYQAKRIDGPVGERIDEFEEHLTMDNNEATYAFSEDSPLMICIANRDCELYFSNGNFDRVLENDEDFRKKVGKNFVRQFFENEALHADVEIDGNTYSVSAHDIGALEDGKKVFFFENITKAKIMENLYQQSRVAVGLISVDNYDDIINGTSTENQSSINAEIDRRIMTSFAEIDAAIMRVRSSRYFAVFEERYLERLKETKFPLIDIMHDIETELDFPTTVSIGVGSGATNIAELQNYAEAALELALGRGGDQAVVKNHEGDVEYFGGALTTVEKRNKGKSRMVAHALRQLINSSEKVFVMGHQRPDMDSIGAAVGIAALSRVYGVPCSIVLGGDTDGVDLLHEAAVRTGLYHFITPEEAESEINGNTLLVVVDVCIPAVTACPALLERTDKRAVIDHHRRAAKTIEQTTLSYTETYASSASELVTEIIQYSGERAVLEKFDGDALLAGITLDTKNFTQNAGVRTFEAASWLRRNGADTVTVSSFFKMDLDFYKKKVNIIASAEVLENEVAVAYTNESDPGMQILVAQAADELLDMRGVKAAIAAGRSGARTAVSARSDGQINVQTLMEKMGGGGHVNIAAAQVDLPPEEAIAAIVKLMREEEML